MPVKPIPDDMPVISPYLTVSDADAAIAFYAKAFSAEELVRLKMPGGKIGHSQLRIGSGLFMVADAFPEMGFEAPGKDAPPPVTMHMYVADVDAFVAKATAAGAVLERPVEDHFYGDRAGTLRDPFGHRWYVSTRVRDVPLEDMQGLLDTTFSSGA